MRARFLSLLALLAAPLAAAAEEGAWKILPARAETPPPRDPSLSRLSGEIREAIAEVVEAEVSMVSTEMRDEACPSYDGKCPRDVAALVNADKVVSLVLDPSFRSVEVRLYDHRLGLTKQGKVPCKWSAGFASCERQEIKKILAPAATAEPAAEPAAPPAPAPAAAKTKAKKAEPSASPSPAASPPAIDDPVIARAAKALRKKFQKCKKHGWGEATDLPKHMEIQFRMGPDGKAREVRVEPPGHDDVPAFACMARILESLKVEAGSAKEGVYRLPLP